MMEKLNISDKNGIRANVTDLLHEFDNGNLKAVAICFKRKDKTIRTFWNGADDEISFLLKLLDDDILAHYRDNDMHDYEALE